MSENYLVTVASLTPGATELYDQTVANLGDSVTFVPIRLINWPGGLLKLMAIPVETFPEDSWVILTDTSDVIFQRPIPNLDSFGYSVLVCDEGLTYSESEFWLPIVNGLGLTDMLEKPVYNMMLAAKAYYFKEFVDMIAYHYRHGMFGSNPYSFLDQLMLCRWVYDKPYGVAPNFMTSLFKNVELGLVKKDDESGLWVSPDNTPYCIVHANGDTKSLL